MDVGSFIYNTTMQPEPGIKTFGNIQNVLLLDGCYK